MAVLDADTHAAEFLDRHVVDRDVVRWRLAIISGNDHHVRTAGIRVVDSVIGRILTFPSGGQRQIEMVRSSLLADLSIVLFRTLFSEVFRIAPFWLSP